VCVCVCVWIFSLKNCKKCVFSQFRVKKFLLNHVIVSLKTEIILLLNSSGFEFDIIILVSSANNIGQANFLRNNGKSFM
jgi:hypothetical protein